MLRTAICAYAQNEDLYILHWAKYHLSIGFDTIILIDNNSAVDQINFLKSVKDKIIYIKDPDITSKFRQQTAYNFICKKYSNDFDWILFIDIDEYLYIDTMNIKTFLTNRPECDAIGFYWKLFGLPTCEGDNVVDTIVNRVDISVTDKCKSMKCIIKPTPHIKYVDVQFPLIDNIIDVNNNKINNNDRVTVYDHACINHYYMRNLMDYNYKLKRLDPYNITRSSSLMYKIRNEAKIEDTLLKELQNEIYSKC